MSFDKTNPYDLFFRFIEAYAPQGFTGINTSDPLIRELEQMMEENNQFFYIGDMIKIQILFTSRRSKQLIGIEHEDLSPYHFFEATHPDDLQRHSLNRTQLFKMAQDLFIAEKGFSFLSSTLRIRNAIGKYSCLLFQCYLFYSTIPYKTVYILQIQTDVNWCKKIKHGYHYYTGTDLSFFRCPDESFLKQGHVFSEREFSIIRLIGAGFSSEQIAEKFFLSTHTVNTHRRNILKKTGKSTIHELIYDLKDRGLL